MQQRIAEAQLTGNFHQERISERTQIVDLPVPQVLVELVSQERVQQQTAEQIEDAPEFLKETVEMSNVDFFLLPRQSSIHDVSSADPLGLRALCLCVLCSNARALHRCLKSV